MQADTPDAISAKRGAERPLRFAVTPGSRVPAYVSGTGRAILAFEPESRLEEFFAAAELTPRTPRTVTSECELRACLRTAREDGYGLAVDERDIGITVIGCPVMKDGAAVAGISCAIASGYMTSTDFVASRIPLLEAAAACLEKELDRFPALMHSLDMSRSSGY
jgi:IclR family transcriptional regulator, pca regulon regulatory protein